MSLIYEPRGRAREYAALACNIYRGCDHRCVYCYAPSATFTERQKFSNPIPRQDFLARLHKELANHPGHSQRVLLCFTCDPYQHIDVSHKLTRLTIQQLHKGGYTIQVLTKGGSRALRDLDLFKPADAFATTLTCLDDIESLKWEPNAALPQNRIETIRAFHNAGISTWVSLEPVLNPKTSLEIIRQTYSFVNLFKIGKLNYHPMAKSIDWRAFALSAIELLESLNQPYYIKRDLQQFLPVGALGPGHIASGELQQRNAAQSQHQSLPAPVAGRQLALFPNP
jgi:DNA repair photolyase